LLVAASSEDWLLEEADKPVSVTSRRCSDRRFQVKTALFVIALSSLAGTGTSGQEVGDAA